jgi:colanic acid biosynthesis glycosyl transferase WcaI
MSDIDKPNILVITPQYAPDFGPSAPIYTSLCEDLAGMGCDVTVITGIPHYGGAEKIYANISRQEILRGVRVIRENVISNSKESFLKRATYHSLLNIKFAISAFVQIRRHPIDVILADAPFFWTGLPVLINSVLDGRPFIYIVHEVFPDVLVRLGMIKNKTIIGLLDSVEKFFYSKAKFVSVLSNGFKQNLTAKQVPKAKIFVVPPCVDTEFIKPFFSDSPLRNKWGLSGKFVILYSGNIGLSQDVDILLSAAMLSSDLPDVCFVVVGEGVKKGYLQSKANTMGLRNIQFHSFLPHEMVPELYSIADISLVLLGKEIAVESVPSKAFTIMASGRPLVAVVGENSELESLIKKSGGGFRVPPGDEEALFSAILKLYRNEKLRLDIGAKARNYVVKHYSKEVASKKYFDIINICMTQNKHVATL